MQSTDMYKFVEDFKKFAGKPELEAFKHLLLGIANKDINVHEDPKLITLTFKDGSSLGIQK